MNPANHDSRSPSRGRRGFTIVEVLMAVAIFGMVVLAIYETWSAVIKASIAGKNAAGMAQRARISIKAIEDALVTAQMFSANGKYYYFLADTADEKCGGISFVARLPASFPGVGHYDHVVRRVTFLTDANRRLIMTQAPMMVAQEKETEPYSLQLAQDVTLFMFEFWDEQKKEYVSTWARTNQLPRLVRVALGLGKSSQNSQMPQDLVTRTVAMPSTAVQAQWQGASAVPGRPGGMPTPMPGAMPGAMPGMMPGGMPGNMPGMYPNQPVRR